MAAKLSNSILQIESSAGPAHVAQAVEHFLGKEKVPGSNPGVGSIPMLARPAALKLARLASCSNGEA